MLIELLAATSLSVSGFERADTFFLKSPIGHDEPNDVADWVYAADADATCRLLNSSFYNRAREPQGERIEDSKQDGQHFLGFDDAMQYFLPYGGSTWTRVGAGRWLAETITWSQPAARGATHRLVWIGEDGLTVLNDPRPAFATRWYVFGPERACHVFGEKRRSHGPLDLQTVELDSGVVGLPAWTLQTGRATLGTLTETGNWLDL